MSYEIHKSFLTIHQPLQSWQAHPQHSPYNLFQPQACR